MELTEEGAAGGHGGGGPDGAKATDLIIATFSQAKPADVIGAREALKESLEKKIVEAYRHDGHDVVMGIYYTEYVTQ
jgi:flagellar FliL protein